MDPPKENQQPPWRGIPFQPPPIPPHSRVNTQLVMRHEMTYVHQRIEANVFVDYAACHEMPIIGGAGLFHHVPAHDGLYLPLPHATAYRQQLRAAATPPSTPHYPFSWRGALLTAVRGNDFHEGAPIGRSSAHHLPLIWSGEPDGIPSHGTPNAGQSASHGRRPAVPWYVQAPTDEPQPSTSGLITQGRPPRKSLFQSKPKRYETSSDESSLFDDFVKKIQKRKKSKKTTQHDNSSSEDETGPARPPVKRKTGRPRKDGLPPIRKKGKKSKVVSSTDSSGNEDYSERRKRGKQTNTSKMVKTCHEGSEVQQTQLGPPPSISVEDYFIMHEGNCPIYVDSSTDSTLPDIQFSMPKVNDVTPEEDKQGVSAPAHDEQPAMSSDREELTCAVCALLVWEFNPPGIMRQCHEHSDLIHYDCLKRCVTEKGCCPLCRTEGNVTDIQ